MDVIVDAGAQEGTWTLTDLLGRAMGEIIEEPPRVFFIRPAGNAVATMEAMRAGPFSSLDQALAAIETHTRGVCRRAREMPAADAASGADEDAPGAVATARKDTGDDTP